MTPTEDTGVDPDDIDFDEVTKIDGEVRRLLAVGLSSSLPSDEQPELVAAVVNEWANLVAARLGIDDLPDPHREALHDAVENWMCSRRPFKTAKRFKAEGRDIPGDY